MLGPDGQPTADLLEDLGGTSPCPGRVVQPAGDAMLEGLGQVGSQAISVSVGPFDDLVRHAPFFGASNTTKPLDE
jgi:hypothetical protein